MSKIRNLLYHVTPIGDWRWNIDQIAPYLHLFNGKIRVVVATDDSFEEKCLDVVNYFPSHPPSVIYAQNNDPDKRESATLYSLIEALEFDLNKEDAVTLYAHTKGVTHAKQTKSLQRAVRLWTEELHYCNLELWPEVEELLKDYPVVGSFKRYGCPKHFPGGRWHYAGTFYWFRNKDLFERDWMNPLQRKRVERYTAEAYPSMLFRSNEAACVRYDNVAGALYQEKYIRGLIEGTVELRARNGGSRRR